MISFRVYPICLPREDYNEEVLSKEELEVAGWGATSDTKDSSENLQQLSINYIQSEKCEGFFHSLGVQEFNLKESQICAGGVLGTDSCTGDSGKLLKWVMNKLFKTIN